MNRLTSCKVIWREISFISNLFWKIFNTRNFWGLTTFIIHFYPFFFLKTFSFCSNLSLTFHNVGGNGSFHHGHTFVTSSIWFYFRFHILDSWPENLQSITNNVSLVYFFSQYTILSSFFQKCLETHCIVIFFSILFIRLSIF